jgi:hypothetical protein
VTLLLNEQATRSAILDEWRNRIRTRLGPDDRILLYFGGHGETEKVRQRNDGTWITDGALVTYGARSFSEMLTVADIHRLSDQLGRARHQLFIINACYGGSLGIPTRGSTVQTTVPGYLAEMTRRPARQFISAGGADQLVMDGGVDGLSFFTHHLLEALGKRYADLDNDGVIILPELTSYLVPRAFNKHQMPAADAMPGHGLGEYVFETLAGPSPSIPSKPTVPISVAHGQLRGEDVQVVERNYEAMRRPIDDLYRALAERDLERYLAQWAEDAIQTGKGKQYSYNDIVAKRSRAFANWEKVEVLRYQISFAGYQENKGQFDARYTMRFTYRSGKEITESDIAERYLVRFDTKQNRWLIAENHDYLTR